MERARFISCILVIPIVPLVVEGLRVLNGDIVVSEALSAENLFEIVALLDTNERFLGSNLLAFKGDSDILRILLLETALVTTNCDSAAVYKTDFSGLN